MSNCIGPFFLCRSMIDTRHCIDCGSCFGGQPPESGCCNTCDEVRESYVRRGWSFTDPDSIEQCVQEGFSVKLKEQATEGCNVAGKVRVNKVSVGVRDVDKCVTLIRTSLALAISISPLAGHSNQTQCMCTIWFHIYKAKANMTSDTCKFEL